MIYGNSYLEKEMKLSYTDSGKSKSQLISMPALTAIATVAVHRLVLLLKGSVLGTNIYHLLGMSTFSVLSLYKIVSVVYFIIWFFRNYTMVTFADVSKNRWYMLRKIHKKPSVIITGTMIASMTVVVSQYVCGFFLTWFLAGLFGYTTHLPTLLPLFLDGFLTVIMIGTFIMFISLVFPRKNDARLCILIWLIISSIVVSATRYDKIIHSASEIVLYRKLFTAPFFLMECICIVVFVAASAVLAYARSARYNVSTKFGVIIVKDPVTGKITRENTQYIAIPKTVYSILGKITAVIVVILLAIALILATLSTRTERNEYSVLGYIPYTVETAQLSGSVENHDFVLFRQYKGIDLEPGDIVLYQDVSGSAVIKKVVSVSGDTIVLDVNIYEANEPENSHRSEINSLSVSGVMVFKSGIIGAVVMLSKSTVGSVLFLAVPLVIIFFYDDIAEIIKRLRYTSDKAE